MLFWYLSSRKLLELKLAASGTDLPLLDVTLLLVMSNLDAT